MGARLDSGEFCDSVNVGGIIAASIVGGLALAFILSMEFKLGMPVGVLVFALLFPMAAAGAVLIALTTATFAYDRTGWQYARVLLGHLRETEQGRWSDIAQTNYQQWFVGGRSGSALFGELSLFDSGGRIVLRARTEFFAQGDPSNSHAVGKRQIGLHSDEFEVFVRLIADETPQLDYVWRPAEVDPSAHFGGLLWNPGPARYVRVSRSEPVEADREALAEEHLPIWRGGLLPPDQAPSLGTGLS